MRFLYQLMRLRKTAIWATALVEGSEEDPVSAKRTDLPVPAQHRAFVPLRLAPAGSWYLFIYFSSFIYLFIYFLFI